MTHRPRLVQRCLAAGPTNFRPGASGDACASGSGRSDFERLVFGRSAPPTSGERARLMLDARPLELLRFVALGLEHAHDAVAAHEVAAADHHEGRAVTLEVALDRGRHSTVS